MQTTVTVTELKAPETAEAVKQKIRLAPYCRVSSPSEDQLHSFAAQIRHYTEYVGTHPEYELVDIYADEGLSGTSMQKRDELNRLLRDCAKGKVDRIITKSVSRLSRNAKEFLETVRLLKSLGVSIYFEEQGIDTDKLNAEMILTFPGLHAQQESENISRNTRWSIQKRMARGEYFGTHAPLGYRFKDGQLTVEEPEAETVRRIFDLYLQGYGCPSIAELLNREGNVSERTNGKILDRWYPGTVRYIIGNERYVGDALLQKQFNQVVTNRIAEIDRKFVDLLRTVSIGNDSAHDAELEALMKEKNDLRQRLQAMEQGSDQHDKRKADLTAILPILRNRSLPYDDTLVRQTVKDIIADSKTKIRVVFPDGETVEQLV